MSTTAVTLERDSVRRKNDELLVMLKEKNKKLMQVQELYDKLKRKAMLGSLQDGASEAVDTALDRVAAIGATPVAADRYQRLGLYQQQADNSKLHGGLQPRITNTWDQQLRRDRAYIILASKPLIFRTDAFSQCPRHCSDAGAQKPLEQYRRD